ncbi:MAG: hypothetical protein QOE70_3763 [Chthoniobacter sp.]|jgi:hypothetical protein|nr:hypothetical protein [Chthoniobacter sp.]
MKRSALLLALTLSTAALGADGLYVAVGYGGRRMTSRDGQTWENVQQWAEKGGDDSNNLMGAAFGKGKFVCVGGGGFSKETQAGHILVSTDGKEWREVGKYPFRVNPVLFLGDRFVAGGPSRQLLSSLDGEKWEEGEKVTLPAEVPGWAFWFRSGAAGNGVFAFMGNAGKEQKTWWCVTTRDGKKIERVSLTAPGSRGLAFGAGKFAAVNPDAIFTSPDAQNWQAALGAPEDELRGIVWTGRQFVLTAKGGTYSSPDGQKWTPFGKPAPGSIVWADERGFIATGWPGKMSFSADGQTWKSAGQPQPAMGVNKVVFGAP